MANTSSNEKLAYLRSEEGYLPFGGKGHLGEAAKAVAPILEAWQTANKAALPVRMSQVFRKQMEAELESLSQAGLRRVVRITDAQLFSKQNNGNLGFCTTHDASREWRECEIKAAVLEQFIDSDGNVVMENFDEEALLTIRQSRHIRQSDRKKGGKIKSEQYFCPSCGAALDQLGDKTTCQYCKADIRFLFFDWQLESFYLDLRKDALLKGIKQMANAGLDISLNIVGKTVDLLADGWEADYKREYRNKDTLKPNSYLGAIITVGIVIVLLILLIFLSLPLGVRIAILAAIVVAIGFGVFKFIKARSEEKKKKNIVRFSDGYLRSCIYDELWKSVDKENLIDFSLDDIVLGAVEHTDSTTRVRIFTTVIKKYLNEKRAINLSIDECSMTMERARYPERNKNKGQTLIEKECPSCGANFMPDEKNNCTYCGYGLKLENYVWRKVK